MEPVSTHTSWKEAGRELVAEALDPTNWVGVAPGEALSARPVNLQRRVGHTRVVASVDVSERLGLLLHVAFRGPALDPMGAAALLAAFLDGSRPLASLRALAGGGGRPRLGALRQAVPAAASGVSCGRSARAPAIFPSAVSSTQ